MNLPRFNLLAPRTIAEACSMLGEYSGRACVMAGGTDLLVSIKLGIKMPEYVINLREISGLSYIHYNQDEVSIGALTLIGELERSKVVKETFPILVDAAKSIASPNVRNLGTLGGNICLDTRCCYYNKSSAFRKTIGVCLKFGGDICHVIKGGKKCLAISQADIVPALMALGASIKINRPDGEKIVPLADIYGDDGKDYLKLKTGEIITEIRIPNSGPGTGGSYKKLSVHRAIDFALVGAAVKLAVRNGYCHDARIVLGSAGARPIGVTKAEEFLKGKRLSDSVIEEAAKLVSMEAKPVFNIVNILPSYRKEMAGVMMIRAAKEALSRIR